MTQKLNDAQAEPIKKRGWRKEEAAFYKKYHVGLRIRVRARDKIISGTDFHGLTTTSKAVNMAPRRSMEAQLTQARLFSDSVFE